MTDLRKAAEMALEALELGDDISAEQMSDALEALRQALAQPDEVLAEREACAKLVEADGLARGDEGLVFIKAAGRIRARSEKPPVKSYCGGKPNYCTPVDAVNMSQERVDETAKREHESDAPDIVVVDESVDGNNTISWMINLPLPVGTRLYTAPPISDYHEGWEEGFKAAKKEWVGLTDEEYDELMLSGDWGGSLIQATQAKLKEKNT